MTFEYSHQPAFAHDNINKIFTFHKLTIFLYRLEVVGQQESAILKETTWTSRFISGKGRFSWSLATSIPIPDYTLEEFSAFLVRYISKHIPELDSAFSDFQRHFPSVDDFEPAGRLSGIFGIIDQQKSNHEMQDTIVDSFALKVVDPELLENQETVVFLISRPIIPPTSSEILPIAQLTQCPFSMYELGAEIESSIPRKYFAKCSSIFKEAPPPMSSSSMGFQLLKGIGWEGGGLGKRLEGTLIPLMATEACKSGLDYIGTLHEKDDSFAKEEHTRKKKEDDGLRPRGKALNKMFGTGDRLDQLVASYIREVKEKNAPFGAMLFPACGNAGARFRQRLYVRLQHQKLAPLLPKTGWRNQLVFSQRRSS